VDLNICSGAYSVKAPISVQDCINMYPEVEKQGSQSRVVLRRFPGLKSFMDLGGSPIRGMKVHAGILYAVASAGLYSVSVSGIAVFIGTIAGSDIVSMDSDGTNLTIVNGTATAYNYDGSSLSVISDLDFVSSSKVIYLDTYFAHLRTDTNQFFLSESGSATSFNALDKASAEGAPEDVVSMITSNRDLILFQFDTTEYWRNTGNADFPFQRQEGTYQERGCLGINTPASVDNDVYFLGDDRIVYRLVGYQSVRVSHHGIETFIRKQSLVDVNAAIGFSITYEGHYWYVLSFPNGTWVHDITSSKDLQEAQWFQLKSVNQENWRVTSSVVAYGKIMCGDSLGFITELDPDTLNENGNQQIKQRTTGYYHNERNGISPTRIKLGFEAGVGNDSSLDPQIEMRISRDWGKTFGTPLQRSMGQAGEYGNEATWSRNGISKSVALRFTVTDDVELTITGAWAEFETSSG